MSLKKIKNYFDPRENLILNRKDEDEDEITFEEARDIGAQRVRTERSGMNATPSTEKQYTGTQTASMPLMTELQKNNLSFDDARQLGMQNHALDYQREIRERALKMMKDAGNKKSPYEALSQEDKSSLDRLYSLKNQLQTFSIYNQTNPQGGNPLLQTQNPYNTDIQQEYNKLYADLNKKGYDVTELIRYYERVKNGEAAEDIKKTLTEKTADHPALMSAASVGLNLLTAQNSFPKAMKDAVYDAAYGTDLGVDTNAPEFFGTYTTNAVREKASTDIIEKTREKYGDGAAWAANLLYGTGMSMADSLTANALGGFSHIGSVIQGINAANSSLIDVSERGVSAGKTLLTAAAAGIFEGLFEDWSLGNLKAMQPEMNSTLKAVGKNVLKQMGVEGSEEAATEIANLTFDTLLNGDKSSIASKRTSYINQGMSKAEATGQVIWDAVRQVAEAGLGGALSGIGFGAGGSVTNYAGYNHQVRQIGSEALQSGQYGAQLRNALQFDPSSPIGQAAIKMVNRDKISNKAAGRFVTQYDRAASEAIQGASNEQEVRDAYRKFSSNEDPHGAIVLSKMADERTRALAAQKVDGERAQEQQNNETSETAVQSTAIEGQAAPRVATSAHETQTRSESNRTTGEYFKRDGTAWRGESGQHDTSEAVSGEDIEIRYATTHLAKLSNTGEQVAVMDVANTDGDMEVLLSNGRTAKLGDLQFDKNEDQILYSMAKQFPTAKARAFVNNYNGSISPENYTRAFNVLYEAGYQGKTSLVKAMQRVAGIPRERKAMLSFLYLAGENRAAAEAKAKQERQPVARGSGRFVNKTGKKLDEAMQLLYMGTAAKTGMTIELRNQIQKDANGAFDAGLSRILLSQSADNQIATLVHETAEYVREYNLEGMLDVQEAMLGWYAKVCNFETLAAMVEDYRNRYEGQLGEESVVEAMGELTNDAMSALFADEAGAQDFLNWLKEDSGKTATQQKNILQTIVELFDRLIEKISEYLHGHSLPKAANVFAEGMDLEQMAALRQMFFEAADQARKNYDAVEKRTNKKRQPSQETAQSRAQAEEFAEVETGGENQKSVITESGEEVPAERIERQEAKYALNPNFERQYDQWDKKNHRMHFNVGTTSEALKSIGVKDTNIEWDSSKIIKIKEKHPEMTDRVIKQVPYVLEHPMLIMQSLQKDSRLTMFGEVYGENGKLVLAIIELYPTSGKGFKMDSMKLVSAYGKDNAQSLIDRSRILYVEPDKKRANRWLLQNRLQLPLSITNYGSIGRIARTDENVNSASTASSIRSRQQEDSSGEGIKYMFAGEKAGTANRAALERAQRETESGQQTGEMIRRRTGWHQGPDGKWRFEIDDSKARFGNESSNRLGDFLLHEELYEAYPELREIKVEKLGEDAPERLRGRYLADEKKIQYDPHLAPGDRMKTLLHEIQHIIQRLEGFGKGGNRDSAEAYLFNRAYDYAKTLPSYQSMQTPKQREQFVKDLIAARSHSGDYETAVTEAYRNLFGEIEARNTANRQPLDQRGRQLASPANPKESLAVTDWLEEAIRYVRNQEEINGTVADDREERYNQDEGGEMHDEETGVRDHAHGNVRRGQRGAVPSASSEKSEIKPHMRSDPSIQRIGTEPGGGEKGVYGGQRSVSNITGLSPKRTSPELKKIEKGSSEYNDTPERTKYSLKRSMGEAGVYMDDLSYRRYPSDNPMSNWGHAMFSDDPYRIEQYGNHLFGVFLTDLVDVEDLKSQIAEAWEKSLASPFSMIHNDSYWEQFSGTEIAENFDPADIVESAEAWDNPELVRWFFEECDFWEGLQGIKTRDGAIVWDQDIIHEGDPDPDNGVTGEDIVNKITKYSFREPTENTPEYAELLSKWGSIKPGYKPFREIKVPKKTSDEKKVRRFVRSVMESNAVTDEMAEDLKGEIVKEAMSYTPISDKQAQDTAKKLLKSGVDKAWRRWNAIVDGDSMPQKSDIALGEYLLRLAAENGDKSEVVRLTAEISELGTRAGQNVQALSMLKKMTGIGQLVYVQRTVDTLNKDLIRRFKGKAFTEVKINEKLAEDLVNAKTPEEVDAAAMEIYKDVADQLPPTWIDKWNAWRYLSMLGNTKTHIRNFLGNAVFAPVVRIKDSIGAGMEAMFIKDGERTKTVLMPKKEYREFAERDYRNAQAELHRGGKQNPMQEIYEKRVVFDGRFAGKVGEKVAGQKGREKGEQLAGLVEKARKFNDSMMEREDDLFLRYHYQSHLAQYLQANKTDLSKMTEGQLERARNYAINQAKKATFRDESALAKSIQRFSNKNVALTVLVEGVLPFKKTPINILRRGVEYSPLGFAETIAKRIRGLKSDGSTREEDAGKLTASEFVDGLASGLTGGGLLLTGMFLTAMGWIAGGAGDDKEDKFAKLQGEQEYAIRIGGISYTFDWTAPAALPFFVGVELMEALKKDYSDMPLRAVFEALENIAEPILNISFLDGLNNTLNSISFADNKMGALIGSVLTNYFMQAIPAFLGHIARSVDPTRRRTYADKNSPLPESFQTAYQKLFNKIPGLSYLNQPYIDEWGRTDKTGFLWAAFENLVSPGWISNIKTSDMEQELLRLYEATGESGVLPGYAAKSITVNGEKLNLTGDEYTQFSEIRGQTAYSTISEIMISEEYESMSDAQKVKAVKDAFEFAGSAAKAAVSEYELEGWQQDANDESQEEGTSIGKSIAHRAATNGAAPEIASTLEEEGVQAAQERIDLMMEACKSRDEMRAQKGNVKSAITRAYKNQYIKCYEARDAAGMREIRQQLMELRTPVGKLYTMKDFRNWIDN